MLVSVSLESILPTEIKTSGTTLSLLVFVPVANSKVVGFLDTKKPNAPTMSLFIKDRVAPLSIKARSKCPRTVMGTINKIRSVLSTPAGPPLSSAMQVWSPLADSPS